MQEEQAAKPERVMRSYSDLQTPSYVPRHPEIFEYNPKFIDPVLLEGDIKKIITEPVEQIYHFKLFTEEYCKLLIDEAEHCGKWVTEEEQFQQVNSQGLIEDDDPETTLHLHTISKKLEDVYYVIVEKHLRPLIETLWKTFKIQKMDRPYILKYEPTVISKMGLHHDMETVALVCAISDPSSYEGGGTYFPKWNYSTGKPPAGSAVVYPGGVSHEHMGLETTQGKRYLFLASYY